MRLRALAHNVVILGMCQSILEPMVKPKTGACQDFWCWSLGKPGVMVIVQNTPTICPKHQLLPPMLHRPPHPLQNRVDYLHVKLLWMKRPTSPCPKALRYLMPRLEEDLQELLIS